MDDVRETSGRRATISAGELKSSGRKFVNSRRGSTLFRPSQAGSTGLLSESPVLKPTEKSAFFSESPGMFDDSSPRTSDKDNAQASNSSPDKQTSFTSGSKVLSEDKKRKIASTIFGSPSKDIPEKRSESGSKDEDSIPADTAEDVSFTVDDNSFDGFSIVKNRVSLSGKQSIGGGVASLSCRSRRSSSGSVTGATGTLQQSASMASLRDITTPRSPQKFHTPMSHPSGDVEKFRLEIVALKEQLANKESDIAHLQSTVVSLKTSLTESEDRRQLAVEEVAASNFMNSIHEQRIDELEQQISRDRMDYNESLSQKSRKHRVTIKKMNADRAEYEARADQMMQQMTEQMGQLQMMAMGRIESLEKDLMSQRHANDKLQAECANLRTAVIHSEQSAAKHRQQAAAANAAAAAAAASAVGGLGLSSPKATALYRSNGSSTGTGSGSKTNTPRHQHAQYAATSQPGTPSSACTATVLAAMARAAEKNDSRKGRPSSTGSLGSNVSVTSTGTVVHEEPGEPVDEDTISQQDTIGEPTPQDEKGEAQSRSDTAVSSASTTTTTTVLSAATNSSPSPNKCLKMKMDMAGSGEGMDVEGNENDDLQVIPVMPTGTPENAALVSHTALEQGI